MASLTGRLLYAASSQLAISFLCVCGSGFSPGPMKARDQPDGPHQALHEEPIFLCRSLASHVPNFRITPLHHPPLQIDWVADILVVLENFRREALKGGMKVGNAVLCEEADEVESLERVLARRGWEDTTVVCVVGLKLGEEAVEGGDIPCTY